MKNSVLNIASLTIPKIDPGVKKRMLLNCPQIRRPVIELPNNDSFVSYLDLSRYIVKELNLDSHLKALIYNKRGEPFFYNLDLMYMRLPKIDFSE